MATTLGKDNPFRYRGYYYDTETGLYYLQSRYYDPETGRFINADDVAIIGASPRVLSGNLFAYCENNPVNIIDIGGYAVINVVCAAIGAVAGWFFGDYVAKKLGYSSGWKYWAIRTGVAIGGAVIGWFAGTLISKVIAAYLKSKPDIVFKLVSKLGRTTIVNGLKILGVNPMSLLGKSKLIGFLQAVFNAPNILMPAAWVKTLLKVAQNFKLNIRLDYGHAGTAWNFIHLHIGNIHIAIVKSVIPYIRQFLGL